MSNISEPHIILINRLDTIRDEYIANLGNSITAINKSWERARYSETSSKQLNDFQLKVHNLTDSCITFELTHLFEDAQKLVQFIKSLGDENRKLSDEHRALIDSLLLGLEKTSVKMVETKTEIQHGKSVDLNKKKLLIKELMMGYLPEDIAEKNTNRCLIAIGANDQDRCTLLELAALAKEVDCSLSRTIGAAATYDVAKNSVLFTEEESQAYTSMFSKILTNLSISPAELQSKINYYQGREDLIKQHTEELEKTIKQLRIEANQRKIDLPPVTSPPVKLDFVTIAYCNS